MLLNKRDRYLDRLCMKCMIKVTDAVLYMTILYPIRIYWFLLMVSLRFLKRTFNLAKMIIKRA